MPGWSVAGETRAAAGHVLPSDHVLPSYDVLPISDFTALPIDTRESEARRYIHEHADRSLDLKGGPLLSAALVRLSASENILLLSMQRSLCGAGVLMSTLIGDLSAQYNDAVGSQSSFLPTPVPAPNSPRSASSGGAVGRESHVAGSFDGFRAGLQQGRERGAVHDTVRGFCSRSLPA
jgi:hypothetical protein